MGSKIKFPKQSQQISTNRKNHLTKELIQPDGTRKRGKITSNAKMALWFT